MATFDRCIYCFEAHTGLEPCPSCGYASWLCDPPAWQLSSGTLLKGRYMVGRALTGGANELRYLGWDLEREETIEIVEYFPRNWVTRDITNSAEVVTIPGHEAEIEAGRQAFFEKAKLFYQCVSRVEEELQMDFFVRNNTCCYTLKRQPRKDS